MARPLVSDELWELIEPLIPKGIPVRSTTRSRSTPFAVVESLPTRIAVAPPHLRTSPSCSRWWTRSRRCAGRRGRPRRRPRRLYGDRAYHSREGRRQLRRRHIQARIAWPKSAHGSGLGTTRWVIERTIAWLHQYRRLRIRYERRDDIHEAFLRDRLQLDLPQAPPGSGVILQDLVIPGAAPDAELRYRGIRLAAPPFVGSGGRRGAGR
jgi:transposase